MQPLAPSVASGVLGWSIDQLIAAPDAHRYILHDHSTLQDCDPSAACAGAFYQRAPGGRQRGCSTALNSYGRQHLSSMLVESSAPYK